MTFPLLSFGMAEAGGAQTTYGADTSSSSGNGGAFDRIFFARQFTPTADGTAIAGAFDIDSADASSDISMGVYTNNSGSPGTQVGSWSDSIAQAVGINDFSWSSGAPSVSSGTTYWMVVRTDTNNSNHAPREHRDPGDAGVVSGKGDSVTGISDGDAVQGEEIRMSITIQE